MKITDNGERTEMDWNNVMELFPDIAYDLEAGIAVFGYDPVECVFEEYTEQSGRYLVVILPYEDGKYYWDNINNQWKEYPSYS